MKSVRSFLVLPKLVLRFGLTFALASAVTAAPADDDLPKRIDQLIEAGAKGPLASMADDATFVRRVYLDLSGRIPTWQEATKFLADKSTDKRAKLIDALLESKEYGRRMQDLFNAMLMERRGDNPEWNKFLEASFTSNKPWDQLAREIIDPDNENETLRGSAFFYTRRLEKVGQQDTDYPGLTRDVGRLFLGMDLQCAQCHNHLFIDSYKQQDFQGLFTVYQNTFIRNDVKFPAIGEKVMAKKIDFMSVFDKVPLATGPRIPGGKEIEIPTFDKGQEYVTPPDRKTKFPGVPKFSALEALSHELPTSANRAFCDNIANRLWFVAMGRGLVNPLDQQHLDNPASHPELMKLLSDEIAAHKFDIKWMIRELTHTQTYQRSTVLPAEGEAPLPETYRVGLEKRLSAEQLMASVLIATGGREKTAPSAEGKPDAAAEKMRAAFVKAFANAPQEPEVEFSPSLKSALFMLNDPIVLECLAPKEGNLVDRLLKLKDAAALADELYMSVLTRKPTDEERSAATEYLAKNQERRQAAVTNLAWSLLACTEFCVNH